MTHVEAYLREIDRLLLDVDPDTRASLIQGIREELGPLDADAAAQRMSELGDPAFIAASAHEHSPRRRPEPSPEPKRPPSWIVPLTIALLTVGGLVIPQVGWVAGVILLWSTSAWTTRQKSIGSLSLLGGAAIIVGTLLPGVAISSDPSRPLVIWPTIVGLYVFALLVYIGISWYLLRAYRQRFRTRAA